MIAYLGDATLKERFVKEIKKHEKADTIIKGTYGQIDGTKWRGCAVGCSLKSMNTILEKETNDTQTHARYESELGIPQVLARLEDRIFEGLSEEDAKKWPRKFAQAITVGSDLSMVWPKFARYLLIDDQDGIIKFANGRQDVTDAIKATADVWDRVIAGESYEKIESAAWSAAWSAESAAWSAESAAWSAASAARSAASAARSAESAAWSAASAARSAESAAWSAASAASAARSAESAAWSAASAESAAWSAASAESAAYQRMSKKLLELLKEVKR